MDCLCRWERKASPVPGVEAAEVGVAQSMSETIERWRLRHDRRGEGGGGFRDRRPPRGPGGMVSGSAAGQGNK